MERFYVTQAMNLPIIPYVHTPAGRRKPRREGGRPGGEGGVFPILQHTRTKIEGIKSRRHDGRRKCLLLMEGMEEGCAGFGGRRRGINIPVILHRN